MYRGGGTPAIWVCALDVVEYFYFPLEGFVRTVEHPTYRIVEYSSPGIKFFLFTNITTIAFKVSLRLLIICSIKHNLPNGN